MKGMFEFDFAEEGGWLLSWGLGDVESDVYITKLDLMKTTQVTIPVDQIDVFAEAVDNLHDHIALIRAVERNNEDEQSNRKTTGESPPDQV